jgi:hypothetical protein
LVSDPVRVALIVAKALEAVRVRYVVGGSLASAVSGEPRSTLDVDLVVELSEKDVAPFIAALGDRFHVDSDALRRAVRERSSTNVIHYATSTKVDLFVAGGSPMDRQQMDRRQRVQVSTNPDRWLYVCTAEDISDSTVLLGLLGHGKRQRIGYVLCLLPSSCERIAIVSMSRPSLAPIIWCSLPPTKLVRLP